MKIVIKLNKSNGDRGNGFEIVVYCNHLRNRKQKVIGYSNIAHFNEEMQLVNEKHPDYEELLPRLMDIKLKARKIIASGVVSVDEAMNVLFSINSESISYIDFCESFIAEERLIANEAEKREDLVLRNRILGNCKAHENSLNQFKKFYPKLSFSDLNYKKLMAFRKHYENMGASKKTIQHYLTQLKVMYNRGIRKYNLPDLKPFANMLDGLNVKSFNIKKKYITIESIQKLEFYETKSKSRRRSVDLFLLQFYLGGCDLTDLYFLEQKAMFNDRVIIERGKTEQVANLKIFPKAKAIIEKYKAASGKWLFGWEKEPGRYKSFSSAFYKSLISVQQEIGIQVLPTGGNLAVKVARHTFGNRAKQLMIDTDIIRELMAHERNDVDNFYKDKFSEKVRDEALFKIIDTDGI